MKKFKLGYKGAPPPKRQRNVRITNKEQALAKFIRDYNDNDESAAMQSIKMYQLANKDQQERILTGWIIGRNLPERLAKDIFNIGDYKYQRIKKMLARRPTGGQKPNYVSAFRNIKYGIEKYMLIFKHITVVGK